MSDLEIKSTETVLQEKFINGEATIERVPSTAEALRRSDDLDALLLMEGLRPRMPLTKDKYLVHENPELIQWERECRKFLRQLSPDHGHRVSAVMIFEWATGIRVAELQEQGGSANRHLRKLNQILNYYFGKPYQTYIAGRKVARAYRVPPGTRIKRRRPMTNALYFEYTEGVLNP